MAYVTKTISIHYDARWLDGFFEGEDVKARMITYLEKMKDTPVNVEICSDFDGLYEFLSQLTIDTLSFESEVMSSFVWLNFECYGGVRGTLTEKCAPFIAKVKRVVVQAIHLNMVYPSISTLHVPFERDLKDASLYFPNACSIEMDRSSLGWIHSFRLTHFVSHAVIRDKDMTHLYHLGVRHLTILPLLYLAKQDYEGLVVEPL
jgi:hypothetical protein